jgi:hypothetical protein
MYEQKGRQTARKEEGLSEYFVTGTELVGVQSNTAITPNARIEDPAAHY